MSKYPDDKELEEEDPFYKKGKITPITSGSAVALPDEIARWIAEDEELSDNSD